MIKPDEHTIIDVRSLKDKSTMHDLEFYFSGEMICAPWHYRTGIRDYFLIHFVIDGKGTFTSNNKTYDLGEKDGFLITPNEITSYRADREHPWSYKWVAFYGKRAKDLLEQGGLSQEQPIFHFDDTNVLASILDEMKVSFCQQQTDELYLLSLLYKFFHVMTKNKEESLGRTELPMSQKELVGKGINFIGKNYSRKMSVEEMSRHIGVSRKHLHAMFKEHLGISPQQYLLQFRMERACQLLEREQLTITEVAQSVGYGDPYLFSRMFKRQKGIAPSYWKKNQP